MSSQIASAFRGRVPEEGVLGVLTDAGIRAMNRLCYFKLLKCVTITDPPAEFLDAGPKFECRFLEADELWRFSAVASNKLPASFLNEALAKGDECYGILCGGELASYGWYSSHPTEIEDGGLAITFAPGWVYMYKGFTDPKYRGQRLHAIGMARALKAYREKALKGIVSYVAADNHSSLKSCYRMGYKDFGMAAISRLGSRYRVWHSPGCGGYGVKIKIL